MSIPKSSASAVLVVVEAEVMKTRAKSTWAKSTWAKTLLAILEKVRQCDLSWDLERKDKQAVRSACEVHPPVSR